MAPERSVWLEQFLGKVWQSGSPLAPVVKVNASDIPGAADLEAQLPRLSVYNHILHGPMMGREEEGELLQQLDYLLKQVQTFLRSIDVEPVELNDLDNVKEDPTKTEPRQSVHKSAVWEFSRGPLSHSKSEAQPAESDPQLLKNRELVNIVQNFSSKIKITIALGVQSNHLSEEFARDLLLHIDCLNKNMEKIMNSSGHCFTFAGLLNKLTVPDCLKTASQEVAFFMKAFQWMVTIADCCIENAGTSPVQYDNIAKESNSILTQDFCSKNLMLNSDSCEKMYFAIGGEQGDESIRQLMVKVKGVDRSLFLLARTIYVAVGGGNAADVAANGGAADVAANGGAADVAADGGAADVAANGGAADVAANGVAAAPYIENDLFCSKLSVSNICGKDLKADIHFPFPSLNAKINIHGSHPYCSYGGGFGFHRAKAVNRELQRHATLNLSGLLGVKCFGAGGKFILTVNMDESCVVEGLISELVYMLLALRFPSLVYSEHLVVKSLLTVPQP
ncbi:hypothetical protein ACQ4PT_039293 [Festuca glaucescens]